MYTFKPALQTNDIKPLLGVPLGFPVQVSVPQLLSISETLGLPVPPEAVLPSIPPQRMTQQQPAWSLGFSFPGTTLAVTLGSQLDLPPKSLQQESGSQLGITVRGRDWLEESGREEPLIPMLGVLAASESKSLVFCQISIDENEEKHGYAGSV